MDFILYNNFENVPEIFNAFFLYTRNWKTLLSSESCDLYVNVAVFNIIKLIRYI